MEFEAPAVGPKQVLKLFPRPSPEAVGADDGAVDTVDADDDEPHRQSIEAMLGPRSNCCDGDVLIRRALARPVVLEELKRHRVPQKDIDTILRLLASRTGQLSC